MRVRGLMLSSKNANLSGKTAELLQPRSCCPEIALKMLMYFYIHSAFSPNFMLPDTQLKLLSN